ncbi:hemerythrin domain-containing protein [Ramlibacter sp.]|uniref:hemerythrin domain-containing protein n=1 Tax=Ramlibacter sp. TaxID=1917967 RepID=UPI003D0E7A77
MKSITTMIRHDHAEVMAAFHKFRPDASPRTKKTLVDSICAALELHARLEEEIFYPALREVSANEALAKSVPEHNEMRALIARVRSMGAEHRGYDDTLYELMKNVIHHVADEETILLPEAERLLAPELGDLGARMARRRAELAGDKSPKVARAALGGGLLLALGAVIVGGLFLARRDERVGSAVQHARRLMWERRMLSRARSIMPEPVRGMLPHPASLFVPKKAKSWLR